MDVHSRRRNGIIAVNAYWDALTEESEPVVNYKPQSQIQQEASDAKAALVTSAKAKLLALGLSEAEVNALV